MIFKKTWLFVSDNTNITWISSFHLYKGFFRKSSNIGNFFKASAKIVEPPLIVYKGFKIKFNKKGDICRSLILRTKFKIKKNSNNFINFKSNDSIIIKKKNQIKSKYLFGPAAIDLKRKKMLILFKTII